MGIVLHTPRPMRAAIFQYRKGTNARVLILLVP
jgi:hypothetical protein